VQTRTYFESQGATNYKVKERLGGGRAKDEA
jgi:hypothetical protein